MFRGSSTMKMCRTSGEKSSLRDSSGVVISTCGTSFTASIGPTFAPDADVAGGLGMAAGESSRTLLLQKTSTFESGAPGRHVASSCQTRRKWCSMSASREPPVHPKCSVATVAGSLCRCGEARRVSVGWNLST